MRPEGRCQPFGIRRRCRAFNFCSRESQGAARAVLARWDEVLIVGPPVIVNVNSLYVVGGIVGQHQFIADAVNGHSSRSDRLDTVSVQSRFYQRPCFTRNAPNPETTVDEPDSHRWVGFQCGRCSTIRCLAVHELATSMTIQRCTHRPILLLLIAVGAVGKGPRVREAIEGR